MTTVTLWILLIASTGHRPVVVVDRFNTEATCKVASRALEAADSWQRAYCIRAEVAR